jgi:hypothetical protein
VEEGHKVANLGHAWAVLRNRITGSKTKAIKALGSMNPRMRKEVGKQQAAGRKGRRKKAYRLGERPRRLF